MGSPDVPSDPYDMRTSYPDPDDMSSTPGVDMYTLPVEDMTPAVEDMYMPPEQDMYMPPEDMGSEPDVDMNWPEGPPPSDSVETVLNQGCTTAIVRGLSEQLIEEMNCIQPNVVASFDHLSNLNLYSAVFPFLQTPAVQGLTSTVSGQNTLTISSALRTIPQQYLLYRWYQQGRCSIGLAAQPGRSNHNGALALDTPDYSAWKSRFQANGWSWLGSSDPVHFNYTAGGSDIRQLSVLAFQKLWNRNNSNDLLVEDGLYGSNTESRLKQAPSNGFSIPPWCPASRQYTERAQQISPPVRLTVFSPDLLELELYTYSVTHQVEYVTEDATAMSDRDSSYDAQFKVALPHQHDEDVTPLAIHLRDAQEDLLRTAYGILPGAVPISFLPEGAGVYRLQYHTPPVDAFSMELYVDGGRVELDPTSLHNDSPFDLLLSLRSYLQVNPLQQHVPVTVLIKDSYGEVMESVTFKMTVSY